MENYYEILGIEMSATEEEIKKAWRKQQRIWHPDNRPNDPEANNMSALINNAYSVLSDSEKREKYDLNLELQKVLNKTTSEEAAKKRAAEETARRKRAAEEAARKRAAEEAARKRAAEEAARKRTAEEAARKRVAEEVARKAAMPIFLQNLTPIEQKIYEMYTECGSLLTDDYLKDILPDHKNSLLDNKKTIIHNIWQTLEDSSKEKMLSYLLYMIERCAYPKGTIDFLIHGRNYIFWKKEFKSVIDLLKSEGMVNKFLSRVIESYKSGTFYSSKKLDSSSLNDILEFLSSTLQSVIKESNQIQYEDR